MSDHTETEDHDRGLLFDLDTLTRRGALGMLGVGLLTLVGCSASDNSSKSASASSCVSEIPEETAGPFPGDGSNGPNVLSSSGIVRSDIRSSFGSSTTTAKGVPLTITLTIEEISKGCAPLAEAAVYVWHCDINGEYSLYGREIADENYLRGVQQTNANGQVSFTSIFPAAYSGRWPHIHFEVYSSLSEATAGGKVAATSQVALPKATCDLVYATDGYAQSVKNMTQTSLTTDNVFRDDGGVHQSATMTGSVARGLAASLVVGV
jgi:protocatechuate 3,4-dioxygenase beta subunit